MIKNLLVLKYYFVNWRGMWRININDKEVGFETWFWIKNSNI